MKDSIKNELINAVGETYSAIAFDVEFMNGEEPEWAELVMDADRITTICGLSVEAEYELSAMTWQEKIAFANSCNYW